MSKRGNLKKREMFLVGILSLFCILGNPKVGQAINSHEVHLTVVRGPGLTDCTLCHKLIWNNDCLCYTMFTDWNECLPCHSPNGAYDGMNNPDIGARYNWDNSDSKIYDASGRLKPGKKKWCIGCHDDGNCVIKGVTAPNIAGQSMSGDWESPISIVDSQILGAENLLDNNLNTGIMGGGGYVIFNLGDSVNVSHLRLYTAINANVQWDVYGGNDLNSWTKILLGQSIIFGAPTWQTGPPDGWNEMKLDGFIPVQYIKLVKVSPWPIPSNSLLEFEFKKDLQYGYYFTGHKDVGCDYCHNTNSTHFDSIAQTYKASLNNYQSGYRLKSVEVSGVGMVPPLEIPRVGCNWGENPRTSNDFALCFLCHDRHKLLGDAYGSGSFLQYPLATNFRNDSHLDGNGKVSNEHLRHLRGRFYCGNGQDWDSDWDGTPDSPQSCTACHNVHGSPSPAMTRHGELVSLSQAGMDKAPLFNLRYLDADKILAPDLSDVSQSTGGQTQFYGPGPGAVVKNKICNMCHNDRVTYDRPVPVIVPPPGP